MNILNKPPLSTLSVLEPNFPPAKEFYRKVFNWTFKPMPSRYSEDEIAMFSFPDEKFQALCGGIVKSDGDPKSRSQEGNLLYLYADDIEEMMAVSFNPSRGSSRLTYGGFFRKSKRLEVNRSAKRNPRAILGGCITLRIRRGIMVGFMPPGRTSRKIERHVPPVAE